MIQPTFSDYKDLLYILDFSTAHRFHVIPSVADSVTETEVLNSILLSVTSDAPKVTKSGVPIVIKSDDLSILPSSAAPRSRVISSAETANAESKVLSRSSDARPNSAASNPTVIESVHLLPLRLMLQRNILLHLMMLLLHLLWLHPRVMLLYPI